MVFLYQDEIKLDKKSSSISQLVKNHFKFIENLKTCYLLLTKDHTKFEVVNKDIVTKGSIIANEENSHGQFITHEYTVTEHKPLEYMKWVSPNSKVYLKKYGIAMHVAVILELSVVRKNKNTAVFHSKLTLGYGSKKDLEAAEKMGSRKIWAEHAKREMKNGSTIFTYLIESNQIDNDPKTWNFDKIIAKLEYAGK